MIMLSRKWSASIVLSSAFSLLLLCGAHADEISDAKSAANNLGTTVIDKLGSKGGIKTNISNPVTTSTPMTTIDGTASFSGQLFCPSTRKFLEILVQPATSGDLSQVVAGQDIDMDGKTDYTYSVPFGVSGVCANGLISCDSGTWANCKYFAWSSDNSLKIILKQVQMSNLGGCYCINQSCGSNLAWTNLPMILKDIGGGIAGTLQAANPQYAVSDVKVVDTVITFFGQKSGACGNKTGGTGVTNPQQYYGNAAQIDSDAETMANREAAYPSSYYSLMSTSLATQQSAGDARTCSIKRILTVEPHEKQVGFDLKFYVGWDDNGSSRDCFWAKNDLSCQNTWGEAGSWSGCKNSNLGNLNDIAATIVSPTPVTCLTVELKNQFNTGGTPGCYGSGDDNTHEFWNYWCYTDTLENGIPVVIDYDLLKQKWDTTSESITNNCQNIISDPKCRLQAEVVDDVYTYRGFNPTGLSPLPSCRTFTGEAGQYSICKDWWEKHRTYVCEKQQGWDFSDAQKRMEKITSTSRDESTSLYYEDLRKNDTGSWITESNTVTLPDRAPAATCEQACKTRKPSTNTQAGTEGNTSQFQTNTVTYEFFYKKCVNGSCPVGAGEDVLKDCQCLNDFAEAASIMETLKQAGQDIICSSGARQ